MAQPQESQPETPTFEVVSETENDARYFYLSAAINVDGKEISRLLLDPKGKLTGRDLFDLVRTYERRYPESSRTTFNKFISEPFLGLVIAKLNKITPEDLYKMAYEDLPLMFLQAGSFQFSGGRKETAKE